MKVTHRMMPHQLRATKVQIELFEVKIALVREIFVIFERILPFDRKKLTN